MTPDKLERIKLASSCSDCDYIPKVFNAGKVELDENGKEYQIMHNGIKTYIDSHYGDFNVEIIASLKGHHEPQEEKVFFEILKLLKPGATMVELGAFWGYYSLWFKKSVDNSMVYLVEPMEQMLQFGVKNFELNNFEANFSQFAIGSNFVETMDFTHWDGVKHKISQINVDLFFEKNDISTCDILHADIQGFEFEMLKGALKSLRNKNINYIFISTHSNPIHYKCIQFLKKFDYKILAEHNLTESFASDGLIVATKFKHIKEIKISKKTTFISTLKKLKYKLFY